MKHISHITYFFKHDTTFLDRVFMMLVVFGLLSGATLIVLNQVDFHFPTVLLFATHISSLSWLQGVLSIILGFIFFFYGIYSRRTSPRSSTFIWGLGLFFWCLLTNLIFVNGVQSTPFPPIDQTLVKIDRLFGINTPALMAWTHNHPFFHGVFHFTYESLVFELLGIPLLLTIFGARKELGIFYIAQLSSLFLGNFIYYFYPTMAPSGIFHSPYFTAAQHDTSLRFYDVHHFIKFTVKDGGLIAFPSFHVVWAILLTNCCRAKKIFFYPVAIFNFILIISTVFLGWHYFTDVIAGIVLAFGAIGFGEWVYRF